MKKVLIPPSCHPEKKYFAKNYCRNCYAKKIYKENRTKILSQRRNNFKNFLSNSINHETYKESRRNYYWNNKLKFKNSHSKYYFQNKLKFKDYQLKRLYKIDFEIYNEIFNLQNGLCVICKKKINKMSKNTHIDHDHKTKKIRGLLCSSCNTGLGLFKENINHLNSAINYIQKNAL